MIILIAGANGYIGGRLSTYLANQGHKIIAVCNKSVPKDDSWYRLMYRVVQVDISCYEEVEKLSCQEIDVIINLVSLDHNNSNGKADIVSSVNVVPTWSLLQLNAMKNLKKYIYLSTIHVYGNRLLGNIFEDSKVNPVNQYGLTHLLTETIVNYFSNISSVDCYNIRFANGFGAPRFFENKCWDLVINNLCMNAWRGQDLILNSDGSPLRDFINIIDLLQGVSELINSDIKGVPGDVETINFSSGHTISILQAAITVKNVFQIRYNRNIDIFINGGQPLNVIPSTNKENLYTLRNDKFMKLFNFNDLHDIEYGINEIFDFLDFQKVKS